MFFERLTLHQVLNLIMNLVATTHFIAIRYATDGDPTAENSFLFFCSLVVFVYSMKSTFSLRTLYS